VVPRGVVEGLVDRASVAWEQGALPDDDPHNEQPGVIDGGELDHPAVFQSIDPSAHVSDSRVMGAQKVSGATRRRIGISLAVGLFVALVAYLHAHFTPWTFDIDQTVQGMGVLWRHQDPYAVMGPHGSVVVMGFRLFYPLPALLVTAPVAWLPLEVARTLLLAAGSAWLAYALAAGDRWRLVTLASAPFLYSILVGGWEPAMMAAALTPGAAIMYLVKPNEGLAFAIGTGPITRRVLLGVGAAVLLLVVSLVVLPSWPFDWRASLATAEHFSAPIQHAGGFLVLLALLKWRRPEARILAVMACVPQTLFPYASLPLFLVPRTRVELLVLAGLSYIPVFVLHANRSLNFIGMNQHVGAAITLALYLPCVVMVLRRPNVTAAPSP
jgi:hypothetical protein